ncbi:molybdopterin-guanine dinucleotide biosynthesis protein B [Paenibacillus beijingensis]|uniref:molybdopterin-guanine dinucleotide biosynthesis protein B n=1 Tax=Paenibacillus beijingensis TaxID=1126833 RepID=UPI000695A969|nr:molybdopterin-guanine dinucleotide biosynthesis protein B [Paenibacillus beijingensis]
MGNPVVFQIVGYKNTGKTTLTCRLIDFFGERGMRTATIKHDAHSFESEPPGCDTRSHREAGAAWSAITSPGRTAVVMEFPSSLDALIMQAPSVDLVLVEGFKNERYPKLLLIREAQDVHLAASAAGLTGIVLWPQLYRQRNSLSLPSGIPVMEIGDFEAIAHHVLEAVLQACEPVQMHPAAAGSLARKAPAAVKAADPAGVRIERNHPAEANNEGVRWYKDLTLDTKRMTVFRGSLPINLTKTEYELLLHFIQSDGAVLTRENMMEDIWGSPFFGNSNVVDVHVKGVRRKLGDSAASPVYIKTVRGVGYRLAD